MITVIFYGSLKQQYGGRFELHADSAAEAVRGLCTQLHGLRQHLQSGHWRVWLDNERICADDAADAFADRRRQVLRIAPATQGAGGRNGMAQIIVGVVLIAASWYMGGAAGWGYLGAAGVSATGFSYGVATMAFMMGTSMMLGGISQMLARPPELKGTGKSVDGSRSTSFSNLDNVAAQGEPVPLIYGEMMVGSKVISQGVETYAVSTGIAASTEKNQLQSAGLGAFWAGRSDKPAGGAAEVGFRPRVGSRELRNSQ